MVETHSKQAQWQQLLGYVIGNQAVWVADIGLKTGLFRAIADTGEPGITDEALAQQLGYFPRYVAVWCRAAYAFEFLEWEAITGYRLAPSMAELLLDPTDPLFIAGRFQFNAALFEDYLAFPESLRSGRIWPRSEHDPWLLEALKNATKPDAAVFTESVMPQAPEALGRLERGGSLLEIGPGAGWALAHYAHRFPHTWVVGLEFDAPSVALARQTVDEAGVGDRVEIRHGDANQLEDEEAYDLVVMNITLHETGGPAEYRNVLVRSRRALRPGGSVLVGELPYPDSPAEYRTNPVYKALTGVMLHEAQVGCGAITQGELRTLLEGAGYANVRIAEQPLPARFVMLAEK